jgi:hypothetical protein
VLEFELCAIGVVHQRLLAARTNLHSTRHG